MKFTKILALVLALIMVVALAACTEPAEGNETTDVTPGTTNTTTPDDSTPDESTPEDSTPDESTPEDSTPVEPEDSTPVEPEDSTPVEPEDSTPVEPEDSTPVEPEDSTPVEPEDSTPEEDPEEPAFDVTALEGGSYAKPLFSDGGPFEQLGGAVIEDGKLKISGSNFAQTWDGQGHKGAQTVRVYVKGTITAGGQIYIKDIAGTNALQQFEQYLDGTDQSFLITFDWTNNWNPALGLAILNNSGTAELEYFQLVKEA